MGNAATNALQRIDVAERPRRCNLGVPLVNHLQTPWSRCPDRGMMVDHRPTADNRRLDVRSRAALQWGIHALSHGDTMRDRIDRIIAKGKPDALVRALDGAKVHDVRYAADSLVASTGAKKAVLKQARDLTAGDQPASHHLACQMIPACYRLDGLAALRILLRLADANDWTVRDAAAETTGRLLRENFSDVLDVLHDWRAHKSPNVRRAVIIAAGRAARSDRPEWADPLLKLLEPLLADGDPNVRRNLGPSALGRSLLACYPTIAFEYLLQWSTSNDAPVLWNVAMAFSGPAAEPIARKALIVLRKLSLDERRAVWRAVASAMWKLGRRCPEIVRPELMRWLEDERRLNVAREALKHI